MDKSKTLLLATLFLCINQFLKSQVIKSFSTDHSLFIEEFEDFMTRNITKENEAVFEVFMEIWENDSTYIITKSQGIIQICNLLLDRKSRPFPEFGEYLNVLISFKNSPDKEQYYLVWEEALITLLSNRKMSRSMVSRFLNGMPLLVEKNIIFQSGYVEWRSSSSDFKFTLEDDKIKIAFQKTNLTCYSKRDSLHLYETNGYYDPVENIWHGEKGLVTWERGGFSRDDVFAKLNSYTIDLKKSEYDCEHVAFTNKFYFDQPLTGRLEDAVRLIKDPEDASFPRFFSYTKRFEISNFYENIDYVGGLSMRGSKLVGTGTENEKAKLFLYNNDTLFMKASSLYFAFTKEKVTGQNTSITLFLKSDSIYHPDLLLTYFITRKELSLLRTDDYTSQSPYFNSYHNVDMNFEQLQWRNGEPYLFFTMARGATIGNASFESVNFFNMNRFMSLQLYDPEHPLVQIKRYTSRIKTNEFYGEGYADYLKLPLHTVKQLLMRMSLLGFIFYNFETDEVVVKDKLYTYLLASAGKTDYDVISFTSVTNAPQENALLNLENYDMTINGMPRVFISDSQNVNIFPEGNSITMKRNRSFVFDGKVEAGLFTFWGNNFFFNYDSFLINLQNVDSIKIKYLTGKKDGYGFDIIGNVDNVIEHVTGQVLIDRPDNKSGREGYAQYPIFKSREPSYVYYDDKAIQNGVYNSRDFYFHMEPFEIDSLDNFKAAGLEFKGTFYSADIFPVFDETLRLQSDNSLGFKHFTADTGKPVYKGKGQYFNLVHLSNAGLRGNGKLEYLTSTTTSDDFIFLPDSMNTLAQEFGIVKKTEGVQCPMVKSTGNYIHWEPYNDSWTTTQTEGPFIIYNDSTTLAGSINLSPEGLKGIGVLDMKRAKLTSKNYAFKANDFDAKTASFELRSIIKGISVKSDSINAHVDYKKKEASFRPVGELAKVEFPENKYVTAVDEYTWFMTKEELEFRKNIAGQDADRPLGANYISVDPKQDSLLFKSPLSVYNYRKNILNAEKVRYFKVADALLFPAEGKVTIESWGEMRRLVEAEILADTLSQYHKMHSASIKVSSSRKYEGMAKYDYIDENDQVQVINFEEVGVDDSVRTYAKGEVPEFQKFSLSPYFEYQGKVRLYARQQFLTYDGASRIVHNCDSLPSRWLVFEKDLNPDSLYIPVTKSPKDIFGRYLFMGSRMRHDSIHIYPAMFTTWQNYSDRNIVSADGYLYFDKGGNRFKISSFEKIHDFSLPGNYLSFNCDMCELYGEGKIDLNIDLGQVNLNSVGFTRHDVQANNLKLDLLMAVDFHIPAEILALTAKDVDSIPGTTPLDVAGQRNIKNMKEFMGTDKTNKYLEELSLYGLVDKLPDELKHTLVFNDIKFEWNVESRSYQSIGKIGVGNIMDRQINKYVDGYVEIYRKRSGDMMDIYLQIDDRNWYYFGYTRGVMQVLSSNKNFIEAIRNMKNKDRKSKMKGMKTPYNIIVSTDRKYLMFVRRWDEVKEARELNK